MILFQILFDIADERRAAFEKVYADVFQPALERQTGFVTSKLVRLYPTARIQEIQGLPSEFNYEFIFVFESEEARRHWAVSKDHDIAWPAVSSLARKLGWRGYDVVASSD